MLAQTFRTVCVRLIFLGCQWRNIDVTNGWGMMAITTSPIG